MTLRVSIGSHIDIVVYSGSSGVGAFNNTVLGHGKHLNPRSTGVLYLDTNTSVSMPGMQPNITCLDGLTPSDFEPLPSSPKPTKSSLSTILPATVVPIMLGLSLTYFFLRRRGTFHRLRRRNGKARLLIDHDHDDPSHDNSTALTTRHASSSRFIGRPSLASSSESTVAHAPSPDPFLVAGPSHLSSSLSKHSRMGLSNPDGADSELRSLPRALSSATQTTRTTTRTGTHATSTSISSLSTLDPFADHGIASVAGVAHNHDYAYAYNLDQTQHTALLGKLADPEAEPLPRLARDEYADDSRWTPSRASSSRSTYRNGRPPSAVGTAASHSRSHESGTAVDPFSDLGSH
jgi:hypothetical protein